MEDKILTCRECEMELDYNHDTKNQYKCHECGGILDKMGSSKQESTGGGDTKKIPPSAVRFSTTVSINQHVIPLPNSRLINRDFIWSNNENNTGNK